MRKWYVRDLVFVWWAKKGWFETKKSKQNPPKHKDIISERQIHAWGSLGVPYLHQRWEYSSPSCSTWVQIWALYVDPMCLPDFLMDKSNISFS